MGGACGEDLCGCVLTPLPHPCCDLQVTYKAPEPMGEHYIAESFDRGTLDG